MDVDGIVQLLSTAISFSLIQWAVILILVGLFFRLGRYFGMLESKNKLESVSEERKSLQEEIEVLRVSGRQLKALKELKWQKLFYLRKNPHGGEDIPTCMRCYDLEGLYMTLDTDDSTNKDRWVCNHCYNGVPIPTESISPRETDSE